MLKFIFSRLLQAVPVLFIVITLTFFLIRFAPGGPFDDEKAVAPEVKQAIEAQFQLDKPIVTQYFSYLGDLFQGNLGPSFKYPGRSVNELLLSGLPITAELGLYAIIVALCIGVFAGVIASLRPNTSQDYVPMSLAMAGICMPAFLLGPILILVFGIWLEWLPVSGWGSLPGDKILPSVTLGSAFAAYIARLTRNGMIEVLSQDYIRTAKAKGLPTRVIIFKHAMRSALQPVVAYLGPAFAAILSGSFVVESVFQIHGLGRFYVIAAFNRDYTMILGTTVLLATLIILFNLLSEVLAYWMNPRLRQSQGGNK